MWIHHFGAILLLHGECRSDPYYQVAQEKNLPVSDVQSDHWAAQAIDWGIQNKIVSGYGNGTFKPNATVTEEEFLAMLIRAYKGTSIPTISGIWSDPYYDIAKTNN